MVGCATERAEPPEPPGSVASSSADEVINLVGCLIDGTISVITSVQGGSNKSTTLFVTSYFAQL